MLVSAAGSVWQRIRLADARVREKMRQHGPAMLRMALGTVFLWFGALKIADRSPVASLVATTLHVLPPDLAVRGLGAVEVLVGAGLLTGVALRPVLVLFWTQLAGTFLVFVIAPGVAFQAGNPWLLTMEGEFVVKNVVLIAAGIVVGGRARRLRTTSPLPRVRRRGRPS